MAGEHFSDAIVDFSGFSKTIGDLQSSFSLLEFLDYCSVMEGIVLHDRLIAVGDTQNTERWKNLVSPLENAGVIVYPEKKSRPIHPGERPTHLTNERKYNVDALQRRRRDHRVARSTHMDSWYETGRLLGAEADFGCTALSLVRQRPYYEKFSQAKPQHTVTSLSAKYKTLSDSLLEIRKLNRVPYESYLFVPIPPVPLLALKRSRSFDDVLQRTLEIRDDFRKLRESLTTLRADLYDDSIPPLRKQSLIQSWRKSWDTLGEFSGSSYVEIGNRALDLPNLNGAIDDFGIDSLKLDSALKLLLSTGTKLFFKWRVRVLHDIANKYLRTPDSELNREVRRLFGANVDPDDLRALHNWLHESKG
jgi:hypothetical protein